MAFFNSKRYLVVGASKDRSKFGNSVLRFYISNKFDCIPVHPVSHSSSLKNLITLHLERNGNREHQGYFVIISAIWLSRCSHECFDYYSSQSYIHRSPRNFNSETYQKCLDSTWGRSRRIWSIAQRLYGKQYKYNLWRPLCFGGYCSSFKKSEKVKKKLAILWHCLTSR